MDPDENMAGPGRRSGFSLARGAAWLLAAAVLLLVWLAFSQGWFVKRPWPRNYSGRIADHVKLKDPAVLRLAVLGDCRDNTVIEKILARARGRADAAVIIGDLVSGASRPGFIFIQREIIKAARDLPVFTGIGNHDLSHDRNGGLFRKFFGPDRYWWRWQGVFFVMINNVERGRWPDEVSWLARTLKERAKKSDRIFIMMHKPPFLNDKEGMNERRTRQLKQAIAGYDRVTYLASDIHTNMKLDYDGIPLYITGEAGAPQHKSPPSYGYLLLECRASQCKITHVNMGFIPPGQGIPGPVLTAYWYYGLPALALALVCLAVIDLRRKRGRKPLPSEQRNFGKGSPI